MIPFNRGKIRQQEPILKNTQGKWEWGSAKKKLSSPLFFSFFLKKEVSGPVRNVFESFVIIVCLLLSQENSKFPRLFILTYFFSLLLSHAAPHFLLRKDTGGCLRV